MNRLFLMGLLALNILSAALPAAATAQNGAISGRILDANGLPMPGATIVLDELGSRGTSSDLNGTYSLVNIPAGAYTLSVTYIGYEPVARAVTVTAGQTTSLDIRLTEAAVVGQEVLVLGNTLQGQARALNRQRDNMNVTNVVSADQVGRFPDANLGDALKRIPGITMQADQGEARNIIIRGMAPQLNSVTVNGNRIPSAEGDNRNVQLDLIPSDMIQSIEVSKAVTPDMEGDAIGGSVNLVTRTTPDGPRFSATAASGLNLLTSNPIWTGSFVLGNRYLDGKLGAVLSASYNYHDSGSDNVEAVWMEADSGDLIIEEFDIREYLVRRVRRSTSLNLDYRVNPENTLYLNAMYNWRDDWENRFRMRVSRIDRAFEDSPIDAVTLGDGRWELPARVEFQTKGGIDDDRVKGRRLEDQRNASFTFGGDHLLGGVKASWSAGYARSSESRPNERYISFRSNNQDVILDLADPRNPLALLRNPADNLGIGFNELSEQEGETFEQDLNARLDLVYAYGENGFIKAGGRAKFKHKERDNSFFFYEPIDEAAFDELGLVDNRDYSDPDFLAGSQYAAGRFATPEFLGGLDLTNSARFEAEDGLEEYISENYEADETVYAAYAMANHRFSPQFSVLGGVRMEYTSLDYLGNVFDVDNGQVSEDTGTNTYLNVLPGLHLRYAATPNTIVRLAWTNTLARPNYYDLVPYAEYIQEDDELARGNPELDPARSMNLDLMAEHYFSNVGIVSAGLFYKNVEDFIYEQTLDDYTDAQFGPGLEFSTMRNGGTATVSGFEIAIQRQILRNLGLYLNYTRTSSETTGVEGRDDELPLPGTAENMFNASLSYETQKLSLRLSMNYASDYIDELGGEAFEDRYYDEQTFVDVNASYTLTPKIRLFAEANNLTNQPLRYYQGVSSRTMQMEYYNLRFNFGIKADLF